MEGSWHLAAIVCATLRVVPEHDRRPRTRLMFLIVWGRVRRDGNENYHSIHTRGGLYFPLRLPSRYHQIFLGTVT